jgi:hypothetical protein
MSTPTILEAAADKRRWNAFVCQDCRGIFRVPAEYDGRGVVCPVCDRMLRIPRTGESIPSLVQDDSSIDSPEVNEMTQIEEFEEEVVPENPETVITQENIPEQASVTPSGSTGGEWRRRKKQRNRNDDVESNWEQSNGKKMLRFSRRMPLVWWFGGAALVLAAVAGIVISILPKGSQAPVVQTPDFIALPTIVEDKDKQAKAAALRQLRDERAAREVVEKLYQVTAVEDLLPLLRSAESLREIVTKHHALNPLTAGELESIDDISPITASQATAFLASVHLTDYRKQGVAVIKVGEKFLVDWESWVGWCEMSYDSIIDTKPTRPVEVRVIVEPATYYNYDFPSSSESEWQSYRLKFPNGDKEMYGYVQRTSEINSLLAPASDQGAKSMTLRIRYRDENSHATQVLIDSVVADGWVKDLP